MDKLARKTLSERRADALSELEMAKARLAKLDNEAAERIGRIAIKSGLVNLDLTDDQVREEFDKIVERISKGN
ncbi:TraC family protein [Escherichia coli]|uniref:TraC family protein n=1 Tax=Enterobacteriaceae TaxID=543 RepID=UPI00201B319B